MESHTIELGAGGLTRVSYLDVPVPPDLLGLTSEMVESLPWAAPVWVREGQPLLGAAAWVADLGGQRLVFDPLQTLDILLRPDRETEVASQEAVARLFANAGFPLQSIDRVVMTHIDGVGMVARRGDDGGWQPFFPNARILMSEVELSGFLSAAADAAEASDLTRTAWSALVDQGLVDIFSDGETLAPGLIADVSGGHGPGHTVFHFQEDGRPRVTLLGHLAVSPIHLATGECAALNEDPGRAWSLLHENADRGGLIAGSLWPTPGYGRWLEGALHPGDQAPR